MGQFFETVEPAMKKIPDSSRRLSGAISELLNRDLELEDRVFQLKDIAEWLRETDDRC